MESERDRLIRETAYQLWEDGGRRDGDAEEHWAEAERRFAAGSEGLADLPPAALSDAAAVPAKKPRKAAASTGETSAAEAKPAKTPAKGRGKAGGTAGAPGA